MAQGVETLLAKARAAERRGDPVEARRLYGEVLARFPGNARARQGLAALPPAPGGAVQPDPLAPPPDAMAPALALLEAGRVGEALAAAEALRVQWPASRALDSWIGMVAANAGDPARSEAAFRRIVARDPGDARAHYNLGCVLKQQGRDGDAVAAFEAGLALDPGHADGWNNLGSTLARLGRTEAAIGALQRALAADPAHVAALSNLGAQLGLLGHHEAAAQALQAALAIRPDHADACNNLAGLLAEHPDVAGGLGRDPAVATGLLERALAADPARTAVLAQLAYRKERGGDWSLRPRIVAALDRIGVTGEPVLPGMMLAWDDDPGRQLVRARRKVDAACRGLTRATFAQPAARPARLRIGYFSADIQEHATMHLLAGVLREHDRSRYEIILYSYGPGPDPAMRARIAAQGDRLVDACGTSDEALAGMARADRLDIAVDLKGHTSGGRLRPFAMGLAPVQVSYLGYPGSAGADFLDYMVSDAIVVPPEQRAHYVERLIALPHSYQPNDDARAIAGEAGTRQDHGLPDTGFVFCSFNATYKLGPAEFDVWMDLLRAVPGSVLWLYRSEPAAEPNLRREAVARGVDPARLVFAGPVPQADHLARHAHADLFLDCFACNAHTTASDALWGGLPLITLAGRSFAARVAASLLAAVGLPELVTHSPDQYRALALRLASDPAALALIRAKLQAGRATAPLFATARYTRALEAGLEMAWQRWFDGLPPADISVPEAAGAGPA